MIALRLLSLCSRAAGMAGLAAADRQLLELCRL